MLKIDFTIPNQEKHAQPSKQSKNDHRRRFQINSKIDFLLCKLKWSINTDTKDMRVLYIPKRLFLFAPFKADNNESNQTKSYVPIHLRATLRLKCLTIKLDKESHDEK